MSSLLELSLQSSSSALGQIVSIGHVFAKGDVAAGQTLAAEIGGAEVALQVDVKARWDDGSVKHAVLSFESPASNETLTLSSVTAPDPGADTATVASLAAAQDYDFEVEIDGEIVDIADLLAQQEGSEWLSGPLANQTRVTHTLANGLELRVDVTVKANGVIDTSVIVGNDNINTVDLETKTYAYAIRQNGVTVLSDDALRQPHHTVWRESFSTSTVEAAHVVYDVAYLRSTGLLPSVDTELPLTDSQIYGERYQAEGATYDPLELGGVNNQGGIDDDRGRTGTTPSYGLITDDQHSYLVSQTRDAREGMLALTDQYGAFSNSYRNPETGEAYFLEDTDFNTWWTGSGKDVAGTGGIIQLTNDGLANRNSYSHKPSEYYLSYLITGDRYYADGLAGEAGSALLLWANAGYLTERGAVDFGSQLREQTAVLRDLFYAASLSPDGSHAADVLNARLDGALEDYVDYFVRRDGTLKNQIGSDLADPLTGPHFVGGDLEGALQNYGGTGVDIPYFQDWFGMVVGQIAATGDARAIELGEWMAGFSAERFLQDDFDATRNLFSIVNYPNGSSLDLAPDASWADLEAAAVASGVTNDTPWNGAGFYTASAWGGTASLFSGTGDARYAEALLWMAGTITDDYVAQYMLRGETAQFSVPVTFADNTTAGITTRTVGTLAGETIEDGSGARIIYAGGGGDIVVAGSGSHLVDGGDGDDAITGGDGEDWIFGGSGADTIAGGAGVNYLQGDRHDEDFGRSADTFSFLDTVGETTIGDFTVGQDSLVFDGIDGYRDAETAIAAFVQTDEGAVLDFGSSGRLILKGVSVSDLDAEDLTFRNVPNAAPVAGDDDGFQVRAGEAVTIDLAILMANDSDPDGDSLTLVSTGAVSGGSLTRNGNMLTFTALEDFSGAGGFDYTIGDGLGGESTAWVAIDIAPATALEVEVTGSAIEDATLVATIQPGDEEVGSILGYRWMRDGEVIAGAENATYTLEQDDVGAEIRVELRYIDGDGATVTALSAGTALVENVNDTPDGTVNIAGEAVEGATLTASNLLTDEDGMGSVAYQWHRDGIAIEGATHATLGLGAADIDMTITVAASYTDGYGALESVLSDPTGAVQADAAPLSEPPVLPETADTLSGPEWIYGTASSETIILTADNSRAYGSGGDDVIHLHTDQTHGHGGRGDDVFFFHGANQRVAGRGGEDSFVIAGPVVGAVLRDFNPDDDTLYFGNGVGGIETFEDFQSAAKQVNKHVIVTTAAGEVRMHWTDLDDLTEDNVKFYRDTVERPETLSVPETGALIEEAGWVDGGVDNDAIISGAGNIRLSGGFGDDHLIAQHWGVRMLGGAGDDLLEARDFFGLLFGGSGMDQFYYTNHADGVIGDFQPGIDRVVLDSSLGFASAAEVFDLLVETDSGAVLESGDDTRITFTGVSLDRIGEDDFLIV